MTLAATVAKSLLALSDIVVGVNIKAVLFGTPRPTRQFAIDRTREKALEYPLRHSGEIAPVALVVEAPAMATSFNPSSRDVSSDKAALVVDDPWNDVVAEAVDAVAVVVVMVVKRPSIDDK